MSVATKKSVDPRRDDNGRVSRELGSRDRGGGRVRVAPLSKTTDRCEQPALHRLAPLRARHETSRAFASRMRAIFGRPSIAESSR